MDFIVTFSYCVWLFVVIGLLFVLLLFIKKNLCPTVCQMLVQLLKTTGRQDPSSVPKF